MSVELKPARALFLGLCAWVVVVVFMLIVSGGDPVSRDWVMVLLIGIATTAGLLAGALRQRLRQH